MTLYFTLIQFCPSTWAGPVSFRDINPSSVYRQQMQQIYFGYLFIAQDKTYSGLHRTVLALKAQNPKKFKHLERHLSRYLISPKVRRSGLPDAVLPQMRMTARGLAITWKDQSYLLTPGGGKHPNYYKINGYGFYFNAKAGIEGLRLPKLDTSAAIDAEMSRELQSIINLLFVQKAHAHPGLFSLRTLLFTIFGVSGAVCVVSALSGTTENMNNAASMLKNIRSGRQTLNVPSSPGLKRVKAPITWRTISLDRPPGEIASDLVRAAIYLPVSALHEVSNKCDTAVASTDTGEIIPLDTPVVNLCTLMAQRVLTRREELMDGRSGSWKIPEPFINNQINPSFIGKFSNSQERYDGVVSEKDFRLIRYAMTGRGTYVKKDVIPFAALPSDYQKYFKDFWTNRHAQRNCLSLGLDEIIRKSRGAERTAPSIGQ